MVKTNRRQRIGVIKLVVIINVKYLRTLQDPKRDGGFTPAKDESYPIFQTHKLLTNIPIVDMALFEPKAGLL